MHWQALELFGIYDIRIRDRDFGKMQKKAIKM